jgi:hypothetical protein
MDYRKEELPIFGNLLVFLAFDYFDPDIGLMITDSPSYFNILGPTILPTSPHPTIRRLRLNHHITTPDDMRSPNPSFASSLVILPYVGPAWFGSADRVLHIDDNNDALRQSRDVFHHHGSLGSTPCHPAMISKRRYYISRFIPPISPLGDGFRPDPSHLPHLVHDRPRC